MTDLDIHHFGQTIISSDSIFHVEDYCMFFILFAGDFCVFGQLHSSGGTKISSFINGSRASQVQGVKGACKQLCADNSKVILHWDKGQICMNTDYWS